MQHFFVILGMRFPVIFAVLSLNACTNHPAKSGIRQEVKTIITGSDKDPNDCKASAGYQWSELRKDCVRSFEMPVQLNNRDNTLSAGLLFNADSSHAEIFCAEGKGILIQKGAKWLNQDWELQFLNNGWTLNKLHSKNIVYSSKKQK